MAKKHISDLNQAQTISDNMVLMADDNVSSKKVSVQQIKKHVLGTGYTDPTTEALSVEMQQNPQDNDVVNAKYVREQIESNLDEAARALAEI